MLPKLAELWDGRKVIYFVATNHIEYFDSAIIRAQRFDALLHVTPPSFQKKISRLGQILSPGSPKFAISGVSEKDIEKSVRVAAKAEAAARAKVKKKDDNTDVQIPDTAVLGKFLLMRWDQLDELAQKVKSASFTRTKRSIDRAALIDGLKQIADRSLNTCRPYFDFSKASQYEFNDFRMVRMFEVEEEEKAEGNRKWISSRDGSGNLSDFPKAAIIRPGVCKFSQTR